MWGAVAFVKEYWAPLFALLPVIVALGFIAYVSRDWRVAAAAVAIVGVMLYAGHLFKGGYDKRSAELRAEYARILAEREKTIAELEAENERRAQEDAARIAELQRKIDETPADPRPGIDRAGAGRVRGIR